MIYINFTSFRFIQLSQSLTINKYVKTFLINILGICYFLTSYRHKSDIVINNIAPSIFSCIKYRVIFWGDYNFR